MNEQMFYAQVMQELHELQERTTEPMQQEAVETEGAQPCPLWQ